MSDAASPRPSGEGEASGSGRGPAGLAAAAGIMVLSILASRVLALVRDMVISHYFGAGLVTDAYNAAFTLPDLFYYLIAGGALSSAFIPVFTAYFTQGDEENAWQVFSICGTAIGAALAVVIVLGEIFTHPLLAVAFPGFSPEKLDLTVALTRIVFPAQICFFLGGLMMSTLYARGHFLYPALGPVIYNVAIIAGGIVGGSIFGPAQGIVGLVWGVLTGAFIGNVLLQVWALRRVGVRYRPSLNLRHPGVIRVGKLMLPVLLGLSLPQLCVILSRPFASGLGDGPITWLDRANKIMQMPLGIFAQGLAVAIFPTLAALAARGDREGLRRHFSLGLRAILFLTVPSGVLISLLAVPISAVLFQRGLGTWTDTQATASAVLCYAAAIFAVSGQQMINRGFYAMQNTVTPMLVGTVATFGFVLLNVALVGVPGRIQAETLAEQMRGTNRLALSYTLSMAAYMGVLLLLFRRAAGGIGAREIGASVGRILAASAVMGLAVWLLRMGVQRFLDPYGPGRMAAGAALFEILLCAGFGLLVYLPLMRLFRAPEVEFVLGALRGRVRRGKGRAEVRAPEAEA